MATTPTQTTSHDNSGEVGSTERDLVIQFNALVTTVAAVIDGASLSSALLTAKQIGNDQGNAITI